MGNIAISTTILKPMPGYIFDITLTDSAGWFYFDYIYTLKFEGTESIFDNCVWLSNTQLIFYDVYSTSAGNIKYTLESNHGDKYIGYISIYEICFGKSTKILCNIDGIDKYINIENIKVGTLVKTYKHGYKRVLHIMSHKQSKNIKHVRTINSIYLLKKNSIRNNVPFAPLYITGAHAILVDKMTDLQKDIQRKYIEDDMYIEDKELLIAVTDPKLFHLCYNHPTEIYHFSLDNNDIYSRYGIYANGVLSESASIYMITKYKSNTIIQ